VKKDWYSIYQWDRSCGVIYMEWIAKWIAESFEKILLISDGLRERHFKVPHHRGQIDLQTGKEQLTEKRIVRAFYNLGEMPILGKILDYEVPLKASRNAKHGDIDLLCFTSETLLCVEAKQPRSNESVLKAILQAFTYTSLAAIHRSRFVAEYCLPKTLVLAPAVLTFASTASALQVREWENYPHARNLIKLLNNRLARSGAAGIRFFVIENEASEVEFCLTASTQKIDFANGFTPKITELSLT